MLALFGVLLATSLVYGVLTSFGLGEHKPTPAGMNARLRMMVVVELIDAALVGLALYMVGRPPRWPRLFALHEGWIWASALPGIALVVGVNSAYHHALLSYLHVTPERDALVAMSRLPLLVVAYCVLPAAVEELFFRYLALDTLRRFMGVHAAVGISSLMFGMAHIGKPLSIPMLTLVGVVFGYSRVISGRLILPMLLHFLHNGIILALSSP